MNRRSFFNPSPFLDLESPVVTPPAHSVPLVCIARRAMATLFEVMIPQGLANLTLIGAAALDLVDTLEDQLTVYRDDSELALLNRDAPARPIRVEERLFGLLQFAAHLTRETQGAFDVASGAIIKAWGFYQRQGRVPTVAERIEAMSKTGMRQVILDSERKTVRYLKAGLEINLGGVGKGYALDRVGEFLNDSWGIRSALLHGGSSSVLAIGTPAGQPAGWPIALRHPWDSERTLGVVNLKDRGLGTSAATHQHFEYNGRKLGHLLDPRIGWPAEQMQQASAIAPTAAEADALSTAFFVMGIEAARRYCESHPTIGAILLPNGDDAPPIVLNTILSAEF